jgi:hypothetical protein
MTGERTRSTRRSTALGALLGLALLVGAPAGAWAAARPAAHTGSATALSYASATLNGSIDPHGSDTSYYFQYGPTAAYGAQTPIADAGAGVKAVKVSAPIAGLQPLTRYYYRLVAVNSTGATTGSRRIFQTTKVPLSLQILVAPNPVPYGGNVLVQGTLSGTENAGRQVVLQSNPFPYTQGFMNVGNAEVTTSTGGFSFPVLGLTEAMQFRVVTTTAVPVVSTVAPEGVAVRVSAHIGRASGRHRVRIYGTVSPAVDGMEVGIMRVTNGRNVLAAGTVLHHDNATSSRFSRTLTVKRGALYRVFVKVTNGAQVSNYSSPLLVR